MNDWLSRIEEDLKSRPIPSHRMDRMARVIREQSAYISASHAVEEACADFNPVDIDSLRKARKQAWASMSDDAKELLK